MTHTHAADMLEDSFPHGTKDGYTAGCRGRMCPAGVEHGLSCSRANTLAAGDYRYQKLVRSGATPGAIADALGLHPEVVAEARPVPTPPRKPLPMEPVVEAPPARPAKWSVRHAWVAFAPDGTMHGPFDGHGAAMEFVADQLRPPAPATPKPSTKRPMTDADLAELRRLHAEDLSDTEIGRRLGRAQGVISRWRRQLGLEANGRSGPKVAAS